MQLKLHGIMFILIRMMMMVTVSKSDVISSKSFCFLHEGKTINGVYVFIIANSLIRCSQRCFWQQCYLIQWDPVTNRCGLLLSVDASLTTTSAAPTVQNYHLCGWNNKRIDMSVSKYTWPACKQRCEDKGGRVFLPFDNNYATHLCHVYQVEVYYVGMYRHPDDDLSTWYDMDGQVITTLLGWSPGQPNNYGGKQYYIAVERGFVGDESLVATYRCVCEI
ncbi:uncharacterized protein [Palaemon carinicauda]|uniref:uncharacterized protein n=1 Tax=Palaemon carinicauda TaxID=392227 RepID=UPI0035B5EA09